MTLDDHFHASIIQQVETALKEDIGSGDITAQLIPIENTLTANVITREPAVLCGTLWVNTVFNKIDDRVSLTWLAKEGDLLEPNKPFLIIEGSARSILTAERTALNFLQTLSYTATVSREYADIVSGTQLAILDTRKTIPGLRLAQKYAVTVGGAKNHRIGLYDAFLIKENHIMAAGSIEKAISMAKLIAPGKAIEVETENLDEVDQAVEAGADIIMLDNFTLEDMTLAVTKYKSKVRFEASGNMTKSDLLLVAKTGVDYISIGALTKHVIAIDLSLRVIKES
ncbi:carboxylating nicotinate-nucleotide diphosphorylase [Marinomonas sp. 15G1-11]|uniref:nicotinate-nucleotide diphosphorylase (carboxylating) n=1 Tax=Marinomonas phaeophyticola TaxID=3004091 RepID=A0ABT4JQF2_9GAMM|nr:carboxylating nicotinate-nucleotide diphosphorylase [Marinomonas sp. 15G1-11]MCZ2720465.1 carboxylating nicotinate-nucleotide diphosphorylase [Marinomonas sp. 15G1-11]